MLIATEEKKYKYLNKMEKTVLPRIQSYMKGLNSEDYFFEKRIASSQIKDFENPLFHRDLVYSNFVAFGSFTELENHYVKCLYYTLRSPISQMSMKFTVGILGTTLMSGHNQAWVVFNEDEAIEHINAQYINFANYHLNLLKGEMVSKRLYW